MKRRITHIFISLFLVFAFPMSVLADTAPDGTTTTPTDTATTPAPAPAPEPAPTDTTSPPATEPAPTPAPAPAAAPAQGPSSPTGDDANTYTYNSTTGLWENPYYTWDPLTHQTSPKTPQQYSYNPSTGMWDTTQYVYNAPSGTYVPNVVSSPTNPGQTSSLQANNSLSNTGPGSTNTLNTSANNNAVFDLFYNAQISNNLSQNAQSGSAAVTGNTIGGSALSGNAMDVMNVINMLKSSFGLQDAADLMTFTSNINGNVVGDLYIDPNQLGPQSVTVSNSNIQNDVTINSRGSGLINNDITLGATSGNATVDSNTNAGDATTGNAAAIANIVNMINSAIAANKSFLGVININGNLDGDILLPPNFLDQLLASNAPHSTVNISDTTNNNLALNSTNNETINSDVNLAAASGNADVANNTNASSATTGSANTNLTVFNLTGKQIITKDSILVFVNVLGQWVGLIMNAPAGTTAAAVGGNVTENNTLNNTAVVNSDTNNTIANNINLTSRSGDASVTNNTNAGNAKTGDATASANIGNIIDSQLSASDWFGILFINVLGVWHGSFGINTDAGTIKQLEQIATTAAAPGGGPGSTAKVMAFSFVPKSGGSSVYSSPGGVFAQPTNENSSGSESHPVILASATSSGGGSASAINQSRPLGSHHQNMWVIPAASFAVVMFTTSAFGGSGELSNKLHARLLSRRLQRS